MLTKIFRAPGFSPPRIGSLFSLILLLALTACQPSGPRALLLGDKYVRQGEYARAVKYLMRAAKLMPQRPEVWNVLGTALQGLQQRPQALESYQRALLINRSFSAPHFNLGVLYLEENKLPQAVAELKTFVAAEPNEAQGWQKLGTALLRIHKPDDAEKAFQQALRINPKDAESLNNLGMAHIQRKRPREAIQAFNAALQANPGYPPALLNEAIVTQQYFGNKRIALERYQAFLATKPSAAYAVQVRGAMDEIEQSLKPPAQIAIAPEIPKTEPPAPAPQPQTNTITRNEPERRPEPKQLPPSNPSTNMPAVAIVPPESHAHTSNSAPPALPAATNLARTTPAPTTPVTNLVKNAEVPKVPANSEKTQAAATPQPAPNTPATALEKAEPEPPVEVVRVEKEPEFKPATDLPARPSASAATNILASTPASEPPLLVPRENRSEEKPGLLDRMNPAHWFHRDEPKSQAAPEREAAPPISETMRIAKAKSSNFTPANNTARPANGAAPTPPPRIYPRYAYRKDISLPSGNRKEAEKYFGPATAAFQQQRWPEAIQLYKKAISADPSYFDAQYNLGLAAYRSKDLPLALAADEQAVSLRPSSADARYNFAVTLREAHYYTDAALELRQLVAESPNDARAHLALASLYAQQLGETALARREYQRVLELVPNHPEAPSIRQWLTFTQ